MSPRFLSRCWHICPVLLAALLFAPAARAQDSFVRVADPDTGRPVLSILGTGIGMAYASLSLEMRCPASQAWTVVVNGVRAPLGTTVMLGFGDPGGGWTPIHAAPTRYEDRSLSVNLDRNAFRAALMQARADYPEARDAEVRIVIGDAVGLAVNRDALVREMTDFARECDPPAATPVAARRGATSVRRIDYAR